MLQDNLAGAVAYITFIPAIIFLLQRSYKKNHFVRFHAWQSIFFAIAALVIAVALRVVFYILALLSGLGYLLASLLVLVTCIGWVILWVVVLIKALQGEFFRLPVIGHFAERD